MSRTVAHLPWNIRALEEHALNEQHDHNGRDCTLPPPTKDTISWCAHQECNWEVKSAFYYTHQMCGCRACTGYYYRKQDRKRSRHQAKALNRQTVKYLDSEDR